MRAIKNGYKMVIGGRKMEMNALVRKYDTKKWNTQLNERLETVDPELYNIIEQEKKRQASGLQLIPSENFTSRAVLDALGSVMQNKYSEGYVGKRYYGGNEHIDQAEALCQKRALEAFRLDPEEWGVNVQPLSGSPANFQVYSALLQPHDRILALDLPHGGHLSHGYQTPTKKISKVSNYFETMGYRLNEETGIIDYDEMEKLADFFRPKLIVAGTSAYSRLLDYERFRKVADQHNAILMADMAHISGLVAADVIPSPFEYADIVTTTTHKSLRGPRGAMIFYRKGSRSVQQGKKTVEKPYDLEEHINFSVFPGHQGGPHNHTISALAACLNLAATPEFKEYQQQVMKNASVLAEELGKHYTIVSGGTDNHLVMVDLKSQQIDGARVERVLELCGIAVNKNTVPGDKSALVPGGLRIGAPAMTSRGLSEDDFVVIAELMHEGIALTKTLKAELAKENVKKIADFRATVSPNDPRILAIKEKVEALCNKFPTVCH
mmetsp:Transcript_2947/g.4300  ORF Transcript_2947/g.4300 Transcript_2947/m.4300 type:complete len:494 (+) Transcript_2947:66-1547(+)